MKLEEKFSVLDELVNFRELCLKNNKKHNSEVFDQELFFGILTKLNRKYPLLFFPEFVEDFFSGYFTKKLTRKHHIDSGIELWNIVENTLKINPSREKSLKNNSLEKNLRYPKNKIFYEKFLTFTKDFSKEILFVYNYNLLRTFVLSYFLISGSKSFEKKSFLEFVFSNLNLINMLNVEYVQKSFLDFLKNDSNVDERISKILKHLSKIGVLFMPRENRAYLNFSQNDIKLAILEILDSSKAGLYFDSFHRTIQKKFPFLMLIPNLNIPQKCLSELEKEEKAVVIKAFWKYSPTRDQLFSKDNLDRLLEIIHNEEKNRAKYGATKFFGRKISPETFVLELEELEKGDFDDDDDQVTRLAGLVLAESAKLESPHENNKSFDFAINLENYNFRPEQLDAMKKLDFQIHSNIQHCKVMIDDTLTMQKLKKLQNSLPQDHQGVVISIKKPPKNVLSELRKNRKIQLIDEAGIKLWVSISDTIPSRVNSLTKIQFDPINDLRGKIARVDSINFESGMASVTVLPELIETNIYVRSLQEISLNSTVQNFVNVSKNYFLFLKTLIVLSNEENFQTAIFNENVIDYKRKTEYTWKFSTKHNEVSINLVGHDKRTIFNCNCLGWQENSTHLCSHILSCLDFMVRNSDHLEGKWEESSVYFALNQLITKIICENFEALHLDLPKEQNPLLKEYLNHIEKSKSF